MITDAKAEAQDGLVEWEIFSGRSVKNCLSRNVSPISSTRNTSDFSYATPGDGIRYISLPNLEKLHSIQLTRSIIAACMLILARANKRRLNFRLWILTSWPSATVGLLCERDVRRQNAAAQLLWSSERCRKGLEWDWNGVELICPPHFVGRRSRDWRRNSKWSIRQMNTAQNAPKPVLELDRKYSERIKLPGKAKFFCRQRLATLANTCNTYYLKYKM